MDNCVCLFCAGKCENPVVVNGKVFCSQRHAGFYASMKHVDAGVKKLKLLPAAQRPRVWFELP